MEITGSPPSSQSFQTRGHAGEGLEFVNLLWAQNGFKIAARNRRAGLAAIYIIILAVYIRRRRERKLRRKHQPEPDFTFFFLLKNCLYTLQIFLYFFSAYAALILKISPIFFQQFFLVRIVL